MAVVTIVVFMDLHVHVHMYTYEILFSVVLLHCIQSNSTDTYSVKLLFRLYFIDCTFFLISNNILKMWLLLKLFVNFY